VPDLLTFILLNAILFPVFLTAMHIAQYYLEDFWGILLQEVPAPDVVD
jgi:hypothetical protein